MTMVASQVQPPEGGVSPSRSSRSRVATRGEPLVWLSAGGLAVALVMILGLLGLVAYRGGLTFWPRSIVEIRTISGEILCGQVVRSETTRPPDGSEPVQRRLLRVGNYDLSGGDFRWLPESEIQSESRPPGLCVVERMEWGPFLGRLAEIRDGGEVAARGTAACLAELQARQDDIAGRRAAMADFEEQITVINDQLEAERLRLRKAALEHGEQSPAYQQVARSVQQNEQALNERFETINAGFQQVRAADSGQTVVLEAAGGATREIPLSHVVRAFAPNTMSAWDKLRVYGSRWAEFLSSEPREANTEGGVFPAIFGTVLMTVLMSGVVAPFGVLAAVYLREYARQGAIVSMIRVAVGNLAGVPSIVYGIFGVGFFCYGIGGIIDHLFYAERLPAPTFGTTGILWASLTLALLTLPVVIVATEEALAAVPNSMREGSLACGASKWQTIRRIVLPKALPGILTGLILAMARGAGEVAPLMITGAVKLAPELPLDGDFPYLHLERSFMHLGFHIYDVGFQSRNSEAAKPMVYTTTILLIAIVVLLNFLAMVIRARLKRRYRSSQF